MWLFQIHLIHSNENYFHSPPREVCHGRNKDEMYLSRTEIINSTLKREEESLEVQLFL